jgi:hypothetical protein
VRRAQPSPAHRGGWSACGCVRLPAMKRDRSQPSRRSGRWSRTSSVGTMASSAANPQTRRTRLTSRTLSSTRARSSRSVRCTERGDGYSSSCRACARLRRRWRCVDRPGHPCGAMCGRSGRQPREHLPWRGCAIRAPTATLRRTCGLRRSCRCLPSSNVPGPRIGEPCSTGKADREGVDSLAGPCRSPTR